MTVVAEMTATEMVLHSHSGPVLSHWKSSSLEAVPDLNFVSAKDLFSSFCFRSVCFVFFDEDFFCLFSSFSLILTISASFRFYTVISGSIDCFFDGINLRFDDGDFSSDDIDFSIFLTISTFSFVSFNDI